MRHIESVIRKNYSEIPHSLRAIFLMKGDIYFTGLERSIFNRKKQSIKRYEDLAALVFGFLEHVYIFKKNLSFLEKIALLRGGECRYFRNLLEESIERISKKIKPCGCKASAEGILNKYDEVFHFIPPKLADSLSFTSEHFKKKILSGKHPFMSRDLHEILDMPKSKSFDSVFVFIESVIHGIDDYIDEKSNQKESVADVLNIICGLNALVHSLLKILKPNLKDIALSFVGKRSRLEQVLDEILFSLIDLSNVPSVEKKTKEMLTARPLKEYSLAKLNMETRAAGIMVFLKIFKACTGYGDRLNNIIELIKINRIMQLLAKDVSDIREDIKNKNYTPAVAWAKKYKRRVFEDRMKELADYYIKQARKTYTEMKDFRKSGRICMRKLEKNFELLKTQLSSRHHDSL